MLWVLMINSAGSIVLSRCLHPVERLSLQGSRPELANVVGKGALLRFTGNACTAPVITSVLRQLVLPLAHPGVLGASTVPRPFNLWQPNEEALSYLAKVKWSNLHRTSIAILERLLFLEAEPASEDRANSHTYRPRGGDALTSRPQTDCIPVSRLLFLESMSHPRGIVPTRTPNGLGG